MNRKNQPRQRVRGFVRTWEKPSGECWNLCADILKQPHTLIAGATGSGKSVLINSLIYTALYSAPCEVGFILIDPKRVELVEYAELPHTFIYACEPVDILRAIRTAVNLMENRCREMQRLRQKESTEPHMYIIVDEFADLMTTQKDQVLKPLCRIAQLGRAAHIHLIAATQRPTRDIINGQIKVNIDSRVALRCPTAQDSRNIINTKGAEALPRVGFGYYLTPDTMKPQLVNIPYTEPAELHRLIDWWEKQNRRSIFDRFKR